MPTQAEYIAAIERARAVGDERAVSYFTKKMGAGRPAEEVKAEYNAAPVYQQIPQAGLDIMRLLAEGATLNHLGEISGGIESMVSDTPYDIAKATEEARISESKARSGSAGTVAQVLGQIDPATRIYKAAKGPLGAVANKLQDIPYVGKVAKHATDMITGPLAGGATGAAVGGGVSAGEDEDPLQGALLGTVIGGGKGALVPGLMTPTTIPAAIEGVKQVFSGYGKSKKKKKD